MQVKIKIFIFTRNYIYLVKLFKLNPFGSHESVEAFTCSKFRPNKPVFCQKFLHK